MLFVYFGPQFIYAGVAATHPAKRSSTTG